MINKIRLLIRIVRKVFVVLCDNVMVLLMVFRVRKEIVLIVVWEIVCEENLCVFFVVN